MKKTYVLAIIGVIGILTFVIAVATLLLHNKEIYTMDATVLNLSGDKLTVQEDRKSVV